MPGVEISAVYSGVGERREERGRGFPCPYMSCKGFFFTIQASLFDRGPHNTNS